MKRLIIALALLISPTVLHAEEAAQSIDECAHLGNLAKKIMTTRQNGVPLSEVMKAMRETMPNTMEAVKPFVLMAYETIQFSAPDARATAIKSFRNAVELQCYKTADDLSKE